ncbi:glycosyltransferase [Agromyces sp. ZXT2-6]|uniref:glycosyltransferase n=1 Tax=Agromyces sp. ZXT2-6 TaxID=3461153 RepID=UPI004054DACA
MNRPRLLIMSFSRIEGDARVLKQVRLFADRFEVTTFGYGEMPPGAVRHIRIPDGAGADRPRDRELILRRYARAYADLPGVRFGREALAGGDWDVIIANDPETAPLALEVRRPGTGVHCDLHEFSPTLHEESRRWMRRRSPYLAWLIRRHVARADSWTTVGQGLAERYRRDFGIDARVVVNASPYADLAPLPVGSPLRLVHSGAGLRNRRLEVMVRGMQLARSDATLDLYLTRNHPDYLDELRALAAEGGRVRVLDPLPYDELIRTLNGYDVGVFVLPPTTFNYRNALPNKLFDYIQARLAILVGPSPEMARIVEERDLGVVSDDFTAESLAAAIESLDADHVAACKRAADAAAHELNAESTVGEWDAAVTALAERSRG